MLSPLKSVFDATPSATGYEHYWLYIKANLGHLQSVKFINVHYCRDEKANYDKHALSWLFLCLYKRQDLQKAFIHIFNDDVLLSHYS